MSDALIAPPAPPRWPQRLLDFTLTRIVLGVAFAFGPTVLLQLLLKLGPVQAWLIEALPDTTIRQTLVRLVLIPVIAFGYFLYVHVIEKRHVTELRGPGALTELGFGLILGFLLIGSTIGVLALLGDYRVIGSNPGTVLIAPFVQMALQGMLEEIIFRGILFRILERSLGSWIALLISAAFFGFGHLFNPNATVWSALAILIEAGSLLGCAFLATRRLWLCIGIHVAWNFGEGSIFSVAVSGFQAQGLLQASLSGPDWLTGGTFGVEASVISVCVCLTATAVLLGAAIRRGNYVRPYWTRPMRTFREPLLVRYEAGGQASLAG